MTVQFYNSENPLQIRNHLKIKGVLESTQTWKILCWTIFGQFLKQRHKISARFFNYEKNNQQAFGKVHFAIQQ